MVRQMISGRAVPLVSPAVALGRPGGCERLEGGYGGFYLSADMHHLGRLDRQQVPGVKIACIGLEGLS
jgi:hypothetical protein